MTDKLTPQLYWAQTLGLGAYNGSDNKNDTGYGNGTNLNLYLFDIIYRLAVIISLKYNINVYERSVEL